MVNKPVNHNKIKSESLKGTLDEWFGDEYDILHIWDINDETMEGKLFCILSDGKVWFPRLFKQLDKDEWSISIDRELFIQDCPEVQKAMVNVIVVECPNANTEIGCKGVIKFHFESDKRVRVGAPHASQTN